MSQKGFLYAAVTAAAIATSLSVDVPDALAHHGWSEYNNQQTLTLTGQIQQVNYGSPHTTIQLRSGNKTWTAVLAPPSRLERRGLPQGALKTGQTVQVVGYPHRQASNEMRAERIIVGKQTVELR
jgi:hypothetical protein